MLKKILFAVVPMMMVATSVMANDDLLSAVANLDSAADVSQLDDADVLGQADVDALLGEDEEDGEEAIAACFRRIGFGGYGSYGGYSYGGHRSFYSPCYSYGYSSFCYTPVTYTYCAPITYSCYSPCYTSYWGCY